MFSTHAGDLVLPARPIDYGGFFRDGVAWCRIAINHLASGIGRGGSSWRLRGGEGGRNSAGKATHVDFVASETLYFVKRRYSKRYLVGEWQCKYSGR